MPAEIIFDAGIGDIFTGRIAGNFANDDMLGSMGFGCAVVGAKVVLVLGHTACGAAKGAIEDVVFGNLTGLLATSSRQYRQRSLKARSQEVRMQLMLILLRERRATRRNSPAQSDPAGIGEKKEASKSQARCTIWQPAQ